MSKNIYQKKVRDITKEATLLRRYWKSNSGFSNSFRARIWQPKLKIHVDIKLDANNKQDIVNEALYRWS